MESRLEVCSFLTLLKAVASGTLASWERKRSSACRSVVALIAYFYVGKGIFGTGMSMVVGREFARLETRN